MTAEEVKSLHKGLIFGDADAENDRPTSSFFPKKKTCLLITKRKTRTVQLVRAT